MKKGEAESHFMEYAIVLVLCLVIFITVLYILNTKVLP